MLSNPLSNNVTCKQWPCITKYWLQSHSIVIFHALSLLIYPNNQPMRPIHQVIISRRVARHWYTTSTSFNFRDTVFNRLQVPAFPISTQLVSLSCSRLSLMQTPKHDDDDSEFSYRLPEDSKRFLQSPRKRRLLFDGSQQQLPPSASIASSHRLPHEKTRRFQYDLKANSIDDLQYTIASGILSPKSPDSHVSYGQDELSLSAIHDTPYTDEPSVSQWELTGK